MLLCTTTINTYKYLFDFGQREVIFILYTYELLTREKTIIYSKLANIDMVERGEIKSQTS